MTPGGFFFCTSKAADTAPQQCGAVTVFSPPAGLLNGVGYNTMQNTENPSIIFSASFKNVGSNGVLAFNDLVCPEGFEDMETIEVSYTDDDGVTQLRDFVYIAGGWYDSEDGYRPCDENDGLSLGQSAWFCSASDPKTITTSGEVSAENKIHTFTEPATLCGSAYPVPFCPNNENVSWGLTDMDTIEVAYTDEDSVTQLRDYVYIAGGWYDTEDGYRPLESDEAIVGSGEGFWLCLQDTESTFSEVSPLADAE